VSSLTKIVTSILFSISSINFCYANSEKTTVFELIDQNNFYIDQIQSSLKKYAKNPFGWSPLNYAIEKKDFKAALIIATYCESIHQRDPYMKGSPQKINALERLLYHARVKQGNKVDPSDEEVQLAYILLGRGIDVKSGPEVFSPLITACWFNIEDLIIRFTELGADVNASCGYSLYLLVENGNLNMASYLIDNGANIKLDQYSLFNAAINSQKTECIDFIINHGLEISNGHYIRHAFNYIQNEINSLDKCSNHSFPALEMFSYILGKGANPNYWVPTEGLNSTNYERAIDLCSLWLALELPSETNAQYFYKNYVIKILLDYGASIP
jgi:hypothetical protein